MYPLFLSIEKLLKQRVERVTMEWTLVMISRMKALMQSKHDEFMLRGKTLGKSVK